MKRRTNAVPTIDRLESRQLLSSAATVPQVLTLDANGSLPAYTQLTGTSATVTNGQVTFISGQNLFVTKTGTLVVKGTDSADAITVRQNGKNTAVTFNGGGAINFTNVKRLLVEANSGDDHVDVTGFSRPSTVYGGDDILVGARATNLIGGAGNDKLVATQTSDVINLTIGGQTSMGYSDVRPSVLSGGAGNDTLVAAGADSVIGGSGNDVFVGTVDAPSGSTSQQIEDLLHTTQGLVLSGIEKVSLTT